MEIIPLTAEDTLPLRQKVLWPDRPLGALRVPGDDDAIHLGAERSGSLVGVASFYSDGPTSARLRKLAVDPAYQGQGLGRALVQAGALVLRQAGCDTLWCDARATALTFYHGLGFTIAPDSFEKSGLAYHKAHLDLRG
ncbi:N-acetyltransferase [Jannaschia pagri]|uniref:N-acetyltransferase n=1 Tax=Jannaschia pagri TaxID=2829797 RepID=A0ABQ4NMN2_9RHOB|nr:MULTISPECIES: GNAT family N-acetyltransferase [unclassified Jannaschia]GIT91838.1 N-acetyltransferase [Jannaschia sp. AI_61]GIT95672.1 N-acetyltransferase [Jannaschia sp. AI_62]